MLSLHRLALLGAVPLAASVFQCQNSPKTSERHFDAPAGIAIANAGTDVPAHVFAFAADPGHFAIRRIDLTRRKLIEPRYPVGHRIGAVAAHTGAAGTVDRLWAIDPDQGSLLSIDPAAALSPTVNPPASSPSCCVLDSLEVISGRTSTQTWTVTYRAGLDRWEVTGSGSGVQKKFAITNDRYETDEKEVRFRVRRTGVPPAEGDQFTFTTDNGVQTSALATSAGALNLVAVGADTGVMVTQNPPGLVAFDLGTGSLLQSFGLTSSATPAGIAADPLGSAVYLTDLGNPVIYRLNTTGPVASWTLETFPAPVPLRDVTVTGDGARLFTIAADADDVFVYAAPSMVPLDFDATIPGFDPLHFPSAVRAIGAGALPHGSRGSGVPAYPVLVTTHAGNLFTLLGGTGCIDFNDANGARLTGASFRDAALTSAPVFNADVFKTNRCGGVTRSETWALIYDGVAKVWRVRGTISGDQVGVMTEGVPYTTDRGEFTAEIDGNVDLPSDDGDTFFLSVSDDIAAIPVGLMPGKPVFFTLPPDAEGRVVERALVPNAASDTITDVDLDNRNIRATYR